MGGGFATGPAISHCGDRPQQDKEMFRDSETTGAASERGDVQRPAAAAGSGDTPLQSKRKKKANRVAKLSVPKSAGSGGPNLRELGKTLGRAVRQLPQPLPLFDQVSYG